jgi:hypothetical protein
MEETKRPILIAAHDAPRDFKARADFICDGVDDQVEMWAAAEAAERNGTIVQYSPGTFRPSRPEVNR